MKSVLKWSALGVTALLLSSTGWTRQTSTQPNAQDNPALSQGESQQFFRANKIVGRNVRDMHDQKVGSVKEVVFNQKGEILALVDLGNDRWAALPWQLINTRSALGNQHLVVNTTVQALKSGPAVSESQWGALNNPNFTKGIYAYYHLPQPSEAGAASSPGGATSGQGSQQQQK